MNVPSSSSNGRSESQTSLNFWATTIAVGSHGIFSIIYVLEFWAASNILPSVVAHYEVFDATMPPWLVLFIDILSLCWEFWFILPLPVLGMVAADAWIFCRLFRNPLSRFLAAAWFFLGLSAILIVATIIMIALFFAVACFWLAPVVN